MATIVANQPYREPWGARLAESFLTDLLLGGIQRGRAATASKREGEYMAQLAAQRQQGGLAPEAGYFDVNPLNPMNPDAVPAPDMVRTPGKMPSLGDAFTLKASDPRFAGISVDRTYDMVNPLYQSWQKEDELARRQAYAAEIAGMSPEDPGFLSNLVGGHVQGFVDPSVVGHGQNMYEHMNPHKTLNTVNTGDAMTGYAFDPGTGGVEELFRQAMGQSPDSRAATGARYAELSESRRRYDQEYADRKKDETFLRSQQVPEGADAQRAMIIENLLTGRTSPQAGTAIGGLMYPKTGARTGGRDYSVLTPAERLRTLQTRRAALVSLYDKLPLPGQEQAVAQIDAQIDEILSQNGYGLGGQTGIDFSPGTPYSLGWQSGETGGAVPQEPSPTGAQDPRAEQLAALGYSPEQIQWLLSQEIQ